MKKPWIFRPFEFWPNETHVIPFHIFLALGLARHRLGLKSALKANYGILHGGMCFTSKYDFQARIGHKHFPATVWLRKEATEKHKAFLLTQFGKTYGYPIIIKPDEGMTGRGMMKIRSPKDVSACLKLVKDVPYLAQAYLEGNFEFGVFWHRLNGKSWISGINQKHYPTVTGDGKSDLGDLARKRDRYTAKWESFLPDLDLDRVPARDEVVYLSRIGSHTMGCMFTDDTNLKTPEMEKKLNNIFDQQKGFNHGRLDVKSFSIEDFQAGKFEVIEVNGIESQATHMFDPSYNYLNALKLLWYYAMTLSGITHEHRKQKIPKISLRTILSESIRNIKEIQRQQAKAEELV